MKKIILFGQLLFITSLNAGPQHEVEKIHNISFLKPNEGNYLGKPNLAQVEKRLPLSKEQKEGISLMALKKFSGEQLDQIYARIDHGSIPSGKYHYHSLVKNDVGLIPLLKNNAPIIPNFITRNSIKASTDLFAGIYFDAENKVAWAMASKLKTKLLTKSQYLKGSPEISFSGKRKKYYKRFPGKMYLGQSMIDSRKESHVVDYAYSNDLDGFQKHPDVLYTINGMDVRRELRKLNEHMYLGRVYWNKLFAYHFVLIKEGQDD